MVVPCWYVGARAAQGVINTWSASQLSLSNFSASHIEFRQNEVFVKKNTENYLFGGQVMLMRLSWASEASIGIWMKLFTMHIGPTGHSNFETNGQNLCQRKPLEGTVFAIRF